jgi:transposase, IS5 family
MVLDLEQVQVCHYRPLIERIITQSERRVLVGEPLSASDKLVSRFESHADIIVKGSRDVEYWWSRLAMGRQRSVAANAGAPHRFLWPRATAGGGRWRLCHSQQLGHSDGLGRARHGIPQKAGLRIEDTVRGNWLYRKLRNFRAGIAAALVMILRRSRKHRI